MSQTTSSKSKRFGRHSFSISNPFSKQSNNHETESCQLRSVEEVSETGELTVIRRASLHLARGSPSSLPGQGERTITQHGSAISPSYKPKSGLTRSKTVSLSRSNTDTGRFPASATSTSLRPKPGNSSGLPKYRPRVSANVRTSLTTSHGGLRKRASAGDDITQQDVQGSPEPIDSSSTSSPSYGPISPLPKRAILCAINSDNAKTKSPPTEAPLLVKSSTITPSPSTPNSHTRKRRSPMKIHPAARGVKSPVSPKKRGQIPTSIPILNQSGCRNHEDQDEEDVSFLLGAVVTPSKPTPSIPRNYARDITEITLQMKDVGSPSASAQASLREDPFLSPCSIKGVSASTIKTPTLTRIHLEMQTPGLLSRMTAPFGMTPEGDGGPSEASPDIRNANSRGSPQIPSLDTSLDLSDREIQPSSGYTPDIRKTDEALATLLKIQVHAMEEQLEESRKRYEEAQLHFQAREHELEGKLIDLATQHQSEMNVQRKVAESLQARIELGIPDSRSRKSPCPGRQGALIAWQHTIESGKRELTAIQERRETLQLLLSSLDLRMVNTR
jgi:hypothetical protein